MPVNGRSPARIKATRFPMLKERSGWFYYRKRIPRHLRPHFGGKHEVVVSLHTQDAGEAKARVLGIAHQTEKALQRARERFRALVVDPDAMAKEWRTETLRVDREDRIARHRDEDSLWAEVSAIEDAVQDHTEALKAGDTKIVQRFVREVLERHRITLTPTDEKKLAHALLRENVLALNTILERATGQWRERPEAPPSPLLSKVLEAWLRERNPPSKTEQEVRTTFARFTKAALDGEDKPIAAVAKDDVRRFRSSLLGESGKVGQGTGALAPATAKKYLTLLGTVFKYATRTGLIESSPVEGMSFIPRGKTQGMEKRRQPFSVEQVRDFFASPLYTGSVSKARRTTPGPHVFKDSMWWVGLILFYSGMRLEEAGALRGKDVKQADGVWGFAVEPGEDRSLKTVTARRFVPLHPFLLSAGLAELARKQGDGWLFPDLEADRHGKRTSALSKAFGRYLRALKLDQGGRVVMHSARHTVADRLRAAGVPEDVRDYLLGHAGGGTGRRYGTTHPVTALQKAVAGIEYPGRSLAHTPNEGD